VGTPNIAHVCSTLFFCVLGEGWSLSRGNAYVSSYVYIYLYISYYYKINCSIHVEARKTPFRS